MYFCFGKIILRMILENLEGTLYMEGYGGHPLKGPLSMINRGSVPILSKFCGMETAVKSQNRRLIPVAGPEYNLQV